MARYDAFLLRVWRTGAGDEERWAIRLEHLPDGQGARLDSLAALMAHLAVVLVPERAPLQETAPPPLATQSEEAPVE